MLTMKSQTYSTRLVLLFSAAWLAVCFGCTPQKAKTASTVEPESTNQQLGELVFDLHRAGVKKSHGAIAQFRFSLKPAADQNKNKFQGIPEGLQNVKIFKWKLSDHKRGTVYGIRGTNAAGDKSYVLDTDNDLRFDDEKIQSSDEATPLTVQYFADDDSRFERIVEIFPGKASDEYAYRDYLETTLQVGQETLPVGIAHLGGDKFLMFGDTDEDGTLEKFVDSKVELALGGSFWKTDIDLLRLQIRLIPGTGKSMTVGATAPEFQLNSKIDTNKPTMFVFCYAKCCGCVVAMAKIEKIWLDQQEQGHLNIVNIVTDEDEKQASLREYNITFPQTVQPELWGHFGVTPTPTIVVIDENNVVRFRGGSVNEELETLIASYSR